MDNVDVSKLVFITLLQVLCASSEDHTLVEPLIVPDGAKPGEFVSFSGYAELYLFISEYLEQDISIHSLQSLLMWKCFFSESTNGFYAKSNFCPVLRT